MACNLKKLLKSVIDTFNENWIAMKKFENCIRMVFNDILVFKRIDSNNLIIFNWDILENVRYSIPSYGNQRTKKNDEKKKKNNTLHPNRIK